MKNLEKELVKATSAGAGVLYDFIADNYTDMSNYQLKEVLLAVLGVGLDNCFGEEDEEAYTELLVNELENRYFGVDDEDDFND